MKKGLFVFLLVALLGGSIFGGISTLSAASTERGFKVSGTKLLDANGQPFVMRGVNYAYTWYKDSAAVAIPAIAKTGANTVRVVLSNGAKWTKDDASALSRIISLCDQNKMIAVLEVQDALGVDDYNSLDGAVNYWISMKSVLEGKEDKVIINIANEWYGTWDTAGWAEGYKKAIPKLRDAGFKHTLMVDGAGWGQYPKSIHTHGVDVLNSDTKRNIIFSIHMYEYSGGSASVVKSNIDEVYKKGLALCIGEFANKHTNGDVDEATIMSYSKETSTGYMAWCWHGNNDDYKYLDISTDASGSQYTNWGNLLINGPNGIRQTSKICSVFSGSNITPSKVPVTTPPPTLKPTPTPSSTPNPTAVPSKSPLITPTPSGLPNNIWYDFEGNIQGWTGSHITGGPWAVTEWKANGRYSLKSDISLWSGGIYELKKAGNINLSGKRELKATVKTATWGNFGTGIKAKMFMQTGDGWQWHEGTVTQINSTGTELKLDLSKVANLGHVRVFGVQFIAGNNARGRSAMYVDKVTIE